jgi:hypothetical protein
MQIPISYTDSYEFFEPGQAHPGVKYL